MASSSSQGCEAKTRSQAVRTGLHYEAVPRFGEFWSCSCLPLLPKFAYNILATWKQPHSEALFVALRSPRLSAAQSERVSRLITVLFNAATALFLKVDWAKKREEGKEGSLSLVGPSWQNDSAM